jgi:hypothetical protein
MRSTAGALTRQSPEPGVLLHGLRLAGGTLLAILWLLALLFTARRLSGALSEALPPQALILLAAALVVGRLILAAEARKWLVSPVVQIAASGLATLATGLFLLDVSLPGSAPLAISASWFLWTAGEAVAWTIARRSLPRHAARHTTAVSPPASAMLLPRAPDEQNGDEREGEEIPAGLVQRLERVASDDGETVYALVRVPLEAGSRLGVTHLAFCPPLAQAPKLAGAPRDEWASDVRITAAETYGARLEIRLDRPAQAGESVLVEVWSEA